MFLLLYQAVNLPYNFDKNAVRIVNIVVIIGLILCYLFILQNLRYKIYFLSFVGEIVFLLLGIIPAKYQLGIIMITSFLFIIVAGYLDFNDILKTFIYFSSIILICTIFFNRFGLLHDILPVLGDGILRVRASLGFKYYSYASHIIFYLICAYIVYKRDKVSYVILILLQILNTWIYYNTDTRAPFILSTFFIGYVLIKKIFKLKMGLIKSKLMRFVYSFSYIICFIILWSISFWSSSSAFNILNIAFSGRLILNVSNLQRYGVPILGQSVNFITTNTGINSYNYIDSAYLQTLIVDGVIFFVIIMIMFTIIALRAVREENDNLAMALFLIAVFAMFDPQLFWPWYSPFCLLLGKCFNLNLINVDFKTDMLIK